MFYTIKDSNGIGALNYNDFVYYTTNSNLVPCPHEDDTSKEGIKEKLNRVINILEGAIPVIKEQYADDYEICELMDKINKLSVEV